MLMEYADSLDEADIQRFNVGQIVTGGFYRRSKSLEAHVRGVNEELWSDAVGALREAIRLNPGLSLPRANLGIAYLFRPAGKDPGKAAQYLEDAAKLAPTDSSLDSVARLAESANLAVAYSAAGDNAKALEELGEVDQLWQSPETRRSRATTPVSNAVAYNRAFLLAQSPDKAEQKRALNDLEAYLRTPIPLVCGGIPRIRGIRILARRLCCATASIHRSRGSEPPFPTGHGPGCQFVSCRPWGSDDRSKIAIWRSSHYHTCNSQNKFGPICLQPVGYQPNRVR